MKKKKRRKQTRFRTIISVFLVVFILTVSGDILSKKYDSLFVREATM